MPGETLGRHAGSPLLALGLALIMSVAALPASAHPARPAPAQALPRIPAASGTNFDYLVIILMENHNLCDILVSCGGSARYMSNLADAWGLAQNDHYCNVNPSLPNYLCLSGGSDFGCGGYDGDPNSNACTSTAWSAPNIVDRLEGAGLTWKAYMEDMPGNCYGANSGDYAVRHNPFVYYNDIVSNSNRCGRIVPAGASDSALISDLASTTTASNYMWLTPNKCNDIHSCPIGTGDAYLADLVQRILSSALFTTQRAALLITFDEGYGQPIYTAWAGRVVKPAYTSSVAYDHFSVLATIESNWNLSNLTANDGAATPMNEFFTTMPPASDTVAPTITIDSPSNRSNVLAPLSVTGTAFDNIAIRTVELRADGGPWTPATGTTSWTASLPLVTGNHTLDARVTDLSGNQNTTGISVTVTGQATGGIDIAAFAPEIVAGLIVAVVVVALILRRRKKREPPSEPRE